jgi:CBS domain-containing membrane protein
MLQPTIDACISVDISDDDIYQAMKDIPGYLDITLGDFKEVYVRAYRHAVSRLMRSVKAAEVMTRKVVSVRETASLAEVAEAMAVRRISGVPVVDKDGRVLGVISEKDFLRTMGGPEARTFMDVVNGCLSSSVCLAAPAQDFRAADIMTHPALTVPEDCLVSEVADLMIAKRINRVPVVDRAGCIRGIISRADVVRSTLVGESA